MERQHCQIGGIQFIFHHKKEKDFRFKLLLFSKSSSKKKYFAWKHNLSLASNCFFFARCSNILENWTPRAKMALRSFPLKLLPSSWFQANVNDRQTQTLIIWSNFWVFVTLILSVFYGCSFCNDFVRQIVLLAWCASHYLTKCAHDTKISLVLSKIHIINAA